MGRLSVMYWGCRIILRTRQQLTARDSTARGRRMYKEPRHCLSIGYTAYSSRVCLLSPDLC